MRAVAAKELVVSEPDQHEHEERDGEGEEAAEEVVEVGEGLGDIERDDDQGEGKAEDDVGEGVDAGHFGAAETEAVFGDVIVEGLHFGKSSRWGRYEMREIRDARF